MSKQDSVLYVRVPRTLREALERERKRLSAAAGVEVNTSAVLRAILERALGNATTNSKKKDRT